MTGLNRDPPMLGLETYSAPIAPRIQFKEIGAITPKSYSVFKP